MNLRRLKITEVGCYLLAAGVACCFVFNQFQTSVDRSLVRDVLEVLIVPYGLFLLVGLLLYRFWENTSVAILSLAVSIVVCAHTMFTYIRVFVMLGSDPKATPVFLFTPMVLLLGGSVIFVVGALAIVTYSFVKKGRAEQINGPERRQRVL